jgi:hypothetical protein
MTMQTAIESGAHCNSCVFFDDHAANGEQAKADAGLCRFNPPVSQPDANARGLWPVVTSDDWCGHFTAPHGRA